MAVQVLVQNLDKLCGADADIILLVINENHNLQLSPIPKEIKDKLNQFTLRFKRK